MDKDTYLLELNSDNAFNSKIEIKSDNIIINQNRKPSCIVY